MRFKRGQSQRRGKALARAARLTQSVVQFEFAPVQARDSGHEAEPKPNAGRGPRRGRHGGRLMMTSLSTLTLEIYYGYLPIYKQEAVPALKKE